MNKVVDTKISYGSVKIFKVGLKNFNLFFVTEFKREDST